MGMEKGAVFVRQQALLTIDWDYFIPEDMSLDMGHREAGFFADAIWHTRGRAYEVMEITDEAKDFWQKIITKMHFRTSLIHVTDSHTGAYDFARLCDTVILFDAHHDLWPWKLGEQTIHCGNWLRAWYEINCQRSQIWWVGPDHSPYVDAIEDVIDIKDDTIRVLTFSEFMSMNWKDTPIRYVHSCRSGCWTPPWFDRHYQEFIRRSGFQKRVTEEYEPPFDGWKQRWNKKVFESAKLQWASYANAQANFEREQAKCRASKKPNSTTKEAKQRP